VSSRPHVKKPVGPSDPPGVPARRAALRLLDAVLRRGLALEAALDGAASGLSPSDRGLAHAIAAEALRRLPDLDALIDSATRNRLPDDAKARFALRIALAQGLGLGTPGHAAISTVLPLVDGGPRKLVHGVFGTLMRQGVTLPDPPTLPDAVALRWHAAWGDQLIEDAERAIAAPPPLDLTLRDPARVPDLPGTSLLPGHLRLEEKGAVTMLEGYAEGEWWVQDIAASLPARLIGKGAGSALDLCAAPGGKTLQLAAAGWEVTAVDVSESRLARLHENLERTGLTAKVIAADLLDWQPESLADAVLLDAPCSATGIFRRHPDVIHRVRPSLIAEMASYRESCCTAPPIGSSPAAPSSSPPARWNRKRAKRISPPSSPPARIMRSRRSRRTNCPMASPTAPTAPCACSPACWPKRAGSTASSSHASNEPYSCAGIGHSLKIPA
jgi:16S rRNA (cytosine967-C5)-methyltransferase